MEVQFQPPVLPTSGTLVVGVFADQSLSAAALDLDAATGGLVRRALAASPSFKAKAKQVLPLVAPAGLEVSRLLLIGLGAAAEADAASFEQLGGVAAAQLAEMGETEAAIALDRVPGERVGPAAAAAACAQGALLRSYRFAKYRTTDKEADKPGLARLRLLTAESDAAAAAFERLRPVAEGVFLARDLVTEPPNILYPESFAERCRALEAFGVEVEILDVEAMRRLGMGAILAVGQGSARESRLVVMRWQGAPGGADTAPLAFVGKGVTFDTGGISLKPGQGMEDMKFDMAGAAAVTGLMRALAGRKAPVNAVGIIALTENMPSGSAQRPSDVVTSASGKTIEVLNTDAEGRLILADALWYAQDRFKPRCLVDLATLTGAVIVALGTEQAGFYANDDTLAERLAAAGRAVGEKLWRMPLGEAYDREIDSDIADVKNIAGNRNAGSIIGAQFLQRFVGEVPWAHLDIAGTAWAKKDAPTTPKGATGYGVRLLDRFVADAYETAATGAR